MDFQEAWLEASKEMGKELGKPYFESWFKSIKCLGFQENNTLALEVPNKTAKDWLEKRHLGKLQRILTDILKKDIDISISISNSEEEIPHQSSFDFFSKQRQIEKLNPKYTFENFVVGNSNRLPHAASLAVASNPGKAYNPLFIYGGVGLGKTHLMQAIGQYVMQNHKKLKVSYVTSERFTNELISAIQKRTVEDFRLTYRNVDLLLIDDIQFLIGKEQTQEEFFHTFNSLFEANKQIVISSDRPPKEFSTLEDRLKSRFGMGLIADIQPPEIEMRIAILQKKSELEGFSVPEDVINYIATEIPNNIRDLESALIKIVAECSLSEQKFSLNVSKAQEILKDILPSSRSRQISILNIQQKVAEYFNLELSELTSQRRIKSVVLPRQIAMYLARELTKDSFFSIGEKFSKKDHTTIIHAYEKISREMKENKEISRAIEEIINRLNVVEK